MRDTREALYRFHKELNRPFSTTAALVARGLELMSKNLTVDRLSAFLFHPKNMILTLQQCLSDGISLEMDEEIHILEPSPLAHLLEGRRESLAYARPHPILYVPLQAPHLSDKSVSPENPPK